MAFLYALPGAVAEGLIWGLMAAEILLNGKSPADIEIATLTPTVTYNEELCAQLGIEVPAN